MRIDQAEAEVEKKAKISPINDLVGRTFLVRDNDTGLDEILEISPDGRLVPIAKEDDEWWMWQ